MYCYNMYYSINYNVKGEGKVIISGDKHYINDEVYEKIRLSVFIYSPAFCIFIISNFSMVVFILFIKGNFKIASFISLCMGT